MPGNTSDTHTKYDSMAFVVRDFNKIKLDPCDPPTQLTLLAAEQLESRPFYLLT